MTDPLVVAARELLAEWVDAEGAAGVVPYVAFARAYGRLPPEDRAELVELGREALVTAPESHDKVAALDQLARD